MGVQKFTGSHCETSRKRILHFPRPSLRVVLAVHVYTHGQLRVFTGADVHVYRRACVERDEQLQRRGGALESSANVTTLSTVDIARLHCLSTP